MNRVQMVSSAVERALSPEGLMVTQFNGSAAGQTVFHLHFHIIPRGQGMKLGEHASGKQASLEVLEEIAEKIRHSIK